MFIRVLIADLTLSFDNVLAVVAASKGNFHLMVIGLLLSVFLIATLASFFADFIKKHQWLGYLGLLHINYCNSINHWWTCKLRSSFYKRKL